MNFNEKLKSKQDLINSYLREYINIKDAPEKIVEAMKYSLMIGGKRIRPMLAISICEALEGDLNEVMPFACGLELIHTYSLIHDDLPSMDNDDLRRGKPTNHKVFGEAIAILAGDGLLNSAFEIMLDAAASGGYKNKYIRAIAVIARASGVKGMIGGQVIDMESEGKNIDIDTLYEMHSKKTGALIEAACIIGGIIADREDKLEEIRNYSKNLGIAFQIVDDILDCVGDSSKLGKMVGSDEVNGKSTFVSILGLDKSKRLAEKYSKSAREIAKVLDSTGFLVELTDFLLNRDH
ncbi:polyprenyl synthetase family protein [Fonticella tunisiensis]|uniref:Farnesyl diphosphate synthase n=1 Tax=Fonticella tunisiensis TaxID=1096341 RepID=A0A4R7KSI6_9CLOT|nr:farnesyl diphosphate synthase [Fonticella tunisiensis]TDT61938.1 farnesyl-diphosphate synthase [Fonticella tunisiensis]